DRNAHQTSRVSVASDGSQADSFSQRPVVSGDGRFVAFITNATNLVPGRNTNGQAVVHDRQTGQNVVASLAPDGSVANDGVLGLAISADGHLVAFSTTATNLGPEPTDRASNMYIRDVVAGTTTRVSIQHGTPTIFGGGSFNPSFSADGRYLAFDSSGDLDA